MNVRLYSRRLDGPVIADHLIPFFRRQIFLGALFTFPILVAIWFTNTWYTSYLPILAYRPYDNTGNIYQVARAVNDEALFDEASYKAYSPI